MAIASSESELIARARKAAGTLEGLGGEDGMAVLCILLRFALSEFWDTQEDREKVFDSIRTYAIGGSDGEG